MNLKLGRQYSASDVSGLLNEARYYTHKPTVVMAVQLPDSGTVVSPRDGQDLPCNAGDWLCWNDHRVWIVEGPHFSDEYGDPPRKPFKTPTDYEDIGRP